MAQIARGIEWGHDIGFYRMVINKDTNKILGATLVGYKTDELIHVAFQQVPPGLWSWLGLHIQIKN